MNTITSSTIELKNGIIRYESSGYGSWSLKLSNIKVIGEYTNQIGPFADDYFFAFVAEKDGSWQEASFYSEGREIFFERLASELGIDTTCNLIASTDFKSQIWWPKHLFGTPMFEFRSEGFFGKLGLANKQYLSSNVIELLSKYSEQDGPVDQGRRGPVKNQGK